MEINEILSNAEKALDKYETDFEEFIDNMTPQERADFIRYII